MGRIDLRVAACLGLVQLGACAMEPVPANPPSPPRAEFDAVVYPIVLRDCGFPACHGSPERFFQIHGPGRTRLDPTTAITAPPTTAERDAAYERARSMLASAESVERSLLLRKPLEVDRGGAPHAGVDGHGRDVFASTDDPRYAALYAWANGTDAAPAPEALPEVTP